MDVRQRLRSEALKAAVPALRMVRGPIEAWYGRSSLVPTDPYMDPRCFPWTADLESHWREVRAELDALLAAQVRLLSHEEVWAHGRYKSEGLWRTFDLFHYGVKVPNVAAKCPRTTALLEQVPGMHSALFSLLFPGAHIPPHRGPFRGVVRYHLALMVPEPADGCGLRVGGQLRHWEEGGGLAFDESYEHEAWNETDGLRAVLFVDVVRPLRQPAAAVNAVAIRAMSLAPHVRDSRRRLLGAAASSTD